MNLYNYLRRYGLTMSDFARRAGTTTATMCRVAQGSVVPRRALMEAIHRETEGMVCPNDLVGLHGPEAKQAKLDEGP